MGFGGRATVFLGPGREEVCACLAPCLASQSLGDVPEQAGDRNPTTRAGGKRASAGRRVALAPTSMQGLKAFADEPALQAQWQEAKQAAKVKAAELIKRLTGEGMARRMGALGFLRAASGGRRRASLLSAACVCGPRARLPLPSAAQLTNRPQLPNRRRGGEHQGHVRRAGQAHPRVQEAAAQVSVLASAA